MTKIDDKKYTRRDDDERSRVESTYRGEILEKRREVELLLGRRGERRGVDGRGLAGRGDAAEGGAREAIGVKVSVQRHGSFRGGCVSVRSGTACVEVRAARRAPVSS